MLESLAINVLSERTLEFVLPGGGKLAGAAIYCAASEYDTQSVSINFLSNGRELFKVQLSGLTLGGASFTDAQAAVVALNAVIGAAFRSAAGAASTTPPSVDMSNYYNKQEVDNAMGTLATTVGTLISNEQTVRQQNDAALQTAVDGKAAASHTHTMYMHNLTLKSADTTILLQYTNDSATHMTYADIMSFLPQNGNTRTFLYPCSGSTPTGIVTSMYHYSYRWDNWINIVVNVPTVTVALADQGQGVLPAATAVVAMTESIVTVAEADFTIYDWVNTIQMS